MYLFVVVLATSDGKIIIVWIIKPLVVNVTESSCPNPNSKLLYVALIVEVVLTLTVVIQHLVFDVGTLEKIIVIEQLWFPVGAFIMFNDKGLFVSA